MLLVAAVDEPVSVPPTLHEVSLLQLARADPAQQACVCDKALNPASPSTPLPDAMAYAPLGHHLAASSLAQPYYSARVVSASLQTTSFWTAAVSKEQSKIMAMQ